MARIAPGIIPVKDQNPYESIRVVSSSEAIEPNDVVVVAGYTGDVLIVEPADATNPAHDGAPLYVARTGAKPRRALWVQPWRVASRVDTDATPIQAPVFLGEKGKFVFEVPSGGSMWYKRRIGTVVDSNVIHFHLG
jgi:hypothetical protein